MLVTMSRGTLQEAAAWVVTREGDQKGHSGWQRKPLGRAGLREAGQVVAESRGTSPPLWPGSCAGPMTPPVATTCYFGDTRKARGS